MGKEAQRSSNIYKGVGGARMRGVKRVWVLLCPEALRSGSSVTLKDKEANALRNLARLTSLDKTPYFLLGPS